MFTLRRETDYALQLLKVLSKNNHKVQSLNEISKNTKISFLFLQKIARKLRMAKIIKAHQGVEGGYELLINPKKTSLKQIIEIMEGQCSILACLDEDKKVKCCIERKDCPIRSKLGKINKEVVKALEKVKLSDI